MKNSINRTAVCKCLALLLSAVLLCAGTAAVSPAVQAEENGICLVRITKPGEGQTFQTWKPVELWFSFINPSSGFGSGDVWKYKSIYVRIERDGEPFDAFKITGYDVLIFTEIGAKFGEYTFGESGRYTIYASVPGAPEDWDSVNIVVGDAGPTPEVTATPEPTPEPVVVFDENGFGIDQCGILREYRDTSKPVVNIPKTVKGIGEWSMACTGEGWVSIIIPETVTWIGEGALDYTTTLETVTLPKSLKTIEQKAFSECEAIRDVHYAGTKADREAMYIGGENECLLNAEWHYANEEETPTPPSPTVTPAPTATPTPAPTDTVTVGKLKYRLDSKAKTASVIGVKSAKEQKLTVPATIKYQGKTYNVTKIADKALKGLKKLTKLSVGKNVTEIGKNAVYGCPALTTVSGMASLKTIGEGAFRNCKALKAFTLTVNVNKIGKNAFNGCGKLTQFTILTTKLKKANVGAGAFGGLPKSAVFKCPKGKLKAYKQLLIAKGAPAKAKYQ